VSFRRSLTGNDEFIAKSIRGIVTSETTTELCLSITLLVRETLVLIY